MRRNIALAVMTMLAMIGLLGRPAQAVELGSSGIEISGSVDAYYSLNFENPAAAGPLGLEQAIRAFDIKADEFSLSLAKLVIERGPSPVGFRVDLAFGPTADLVHAFEFLGAGDVGSDTFKNVLQAYVTYVAPLGNGLTIDFGKFVTHIGLEVIESQDNWNYSRGILFTWAIPFYHAGIRASYPVVDGVTVTLLAVNGWNNVEENNDGKSIGAQILVELAPNVTFIQNAMWGSELGSNLRRDVYDTIVMVDVTDQLSLAVNFDFGRDDCVVLTAGVCTTVGNSSWYGLAGYGRYAITDATALALRGEWFKDADGIQTGTAQSLGEITATGEWKVGNGLLTRLEYRRDWSNKNYFIDGTGVATRSAEDTITLGVVYSF